MCTKRSFAVAAGPSSLNSSASAVYQVFDRNAKRMQKRRAATKDAGQASRTVEYVRNEVADRMMERFLVSRFLFPRHLLQC